MKKQILFGMAFIFLFTVSCEKEDGEGDGGNGTQSILQSKSWNISTFYLAVPDTAIQNILDMDYMSIDCSVTVDGEEGTSCEICLMHKLESVTVSFTGQQSESNHQYRTTKTVSGDACDEENGTFTMGTSSKMEKHAYTYNADSDQITANFGNIYSIEEGDDETGLFELTYNVVSASNEKIVLEGEKTIGGETLEIKLVLE